MSEETKTPQAVAPEQPSSGEPENPGDVGASESVSDAAAAEAKPDASVSAPATPSDDATPEGEAGETDEAKTAGRGAKPKTGDARRRKRKPPFPALMRAFRTGLPVEGSVERVIKGGYEVKVGEARGFCPHSQISLERENDPESHVGTTHRFRIMQFRRGGEDLVLSRRALLEERRSEEAKAVRATLIEGAVMQGHVAGMAKFGAFIDLGAGVQGLAHISELSHKRVMRVEDAVSVGETVQVKVLKVDDKGGRLSLSIRAAQDDPWAGISERFPIGSVHPGKVVRLADFGAFVELAPGLEALAPASEFPPSPNGWKQGLEVGSTLDWHVLSASPRERRLSITLPGEGGASPASLEVNANLEGKVQRLEGYGVFVWLGPGQVGLMPRAWTGTPSGTELQRRFSVGDSVEVTVVEITEDGRRIRLCRKGVEPEAQAAPKREREREREEKYEPAPASEPEGTFGTSLADKLRAALGQSDD